MTGRSTDQRAARLVRALRAEGETVTAVLVEGSKIRLELGAGPTPKSPDVTEADLIDWSKYR